MSQKYKYSFRREILVVKLYNKKKGRKSLSNGPHAARGLDTPGLDTAAYHKIVDKKRAKLANLNNCVVPFLSRAVANLCWYYHTTFFSDFFVSFAERQWIFTGTFSFLYHNQ